MKTLIKILAAIGISFLAIKLQLILQSNYLTKFLETNLVTLLIALLAINITSLSIILTKIRDLIDAKGAKSSFEKTKGEMVNSIRIQIALIATSLVLLIANDSSICLKNPDFGELIEIGIISCFVSSLFILYDTAKSVFVILSFSIDG